MKEINIAKTLIAKRKEKGTTQDELASYIGISKASVSKWETGQSYPDITFLPQLASYFNITIDELIGYSPQMTKADIKKLYHRLSAAFGKQPFDEVLGECRQVIKKYYSCFPLLLQMSLLLFNHHMLAPVKEKQEEILSEIIDLCSRIKSESEDMWLTRQANSIKATCFLMLQRPDEVFPLLDGTMKPQHDDEAILANAYMQTGDVAKAKQVMQISIYQHVLMTVGNAPLLLLTCGDDTVRFEETAHRILGIIDLFQLEKLNPNSVLIIYLSIAQGYAMQQNEDKALDALQKYAELCLDGFFPYTLHGDEFFDSIEPWFAELDLGTQAPRDEKFIKESMLQGIEANPAFAPLAQTARYKNIIQNLRSNLGGKTYE